MERSDPAPPALVETVPVGSVSDLPAVPAVYVMYGGQGQSLQAAYVGVADNVRRRVRQHLIRHSSSGTTGTSVGSLNPDLVTEVRWWEYPHFSNRIVLEAADVVAFDVFQPTLRSRGGVQAQSQTLCEKASFRSDMEALFGQPPSGRLVIPTLQDALERIRELERRVAALEEG